ncbi:unnamed protein product [Rotaria sp. Silwood2]|nr:unnamed protein product [Rotaria sp. Silwood2]CAF4135602.1 unnamed protein product [Rotaria sp. Silwood2]
MGDWLTNQQKKDLARRNFRRIAIQRSDHRIPWDDCEKIVKNIFLHVSAARLNGLMSDADEDGTCLIRLGPFMKMIKYLLDEQVDGIDEDEDEDFESEHSVDEGTRYEHPAHEQPERILLDEVEQQQNLLDFAMQIKQLVEAEQPDDAVPKTKIKELFKEYKIFD